MAWLCNLLGCQDAQSHHLLTASRDGDAELAAAVLTKSPRKAWTTIPWGGQSPWHLAAAAGHAGVLQAMVGALRAVPLSALQGITVSETETVPEAIARAVQRADAKDLTPLHMACIKGHAQAAAVLMDAGANPFAMDSVGRTPLHYAASWGHADCINAVLGYHSGPPKEGWGYAWPNTGGTRVVDVRNVAGFTPLHYAVWVGRRDAILALASYDASLTVTNIANDFEWIKVGTGNTPLHLAAYGGDFDVVKLLLAGYVQSLAAGPQVMTARHGQWGERHLDDVRHMRNRRGWMPYHIAVRKGFENLAELLHPDIPYTFLFSNDDMEPGTVRMYGPARLMVIAAKALQGKLVAELAAVAAASAAAAAATAAAAAGRAGASPAASAALGTRARPPAAAGEAAAPAGDVGGEAAAGDLRPAPRLPSACSAPVLSPFAASAQQTFDTASFNTASQPSNAATPAGSMSPAVPLTAAAAALSGAAASGSNGSSIGVAPAGASSPSSATAAGAGRPQAGGRLLPLSTAPAALLDAGAPTAGVQRSSGHGPSRLRASIDAAGASNGTVPVAAAAAASNGQARANAQPLWPSRPQRDSLKTRGSKPSSELPRDMLPPSAVRCMPEDEVDDAPMPTRQATRTAADASRRIHSVSSPRRHRGAGPPAASGHSVLQARTAASSTAAPWRLASLPGGIGSRIMRGQPSNSSVLDAPAGGAAAAPPPATAPTAAAGAAGRQQEAASSSSPAAVAAVAAAATPAAPAGAGQRTSPAPPPGDAAAAAASAASAPMPGALHVMLTARAEQMGDNPEALRQQLLSMKLASGMLRFNDAVSAFTASLGDGTPAASARLASAITPPRSTRGSFSSGRGGVAGAAAAPTAADAGQGTCDAGGAHAGSGVWPPPAGAVAAATVAAAAVAGQLARQPSASLQRLLSGGMSNRRAASSALLLQQQAQQQASGGLPHSQSESVVGREAVAAVGISAPGSSRGSLQPPVSAAAARLATAGSGSSAGDGALPIIQQSFSGAPGAAAALLAAAGADSDEADDTCEICFDAAAVVALRECGHTLCVSCCKELCKLHHFKPGLCPYCRQIVAGFARATCTFVP